MSTTRGVAQRIVAEWSDVYQVDQAGPGTKARLADAIDKALQVEREQAAKAAHLYISRAGFHELANDCAAAIREGKPQE